MKIVVSGGSGLIGRALCARLAARGDGVRRLSRHESARSGNNEIAWNPAAGRVDSAALEGSDVIVHLAGEPLAGGRWTKEKRERIRASRVEGTRLLAETIAGLARQPRILLSASATGIYGSRHDELLDESSERGIGFLADVCAAWEEATMAAERAGVRVARLRIGLVLDARGGALASMLPLFRLGLGGPLGNGRQWMSWISLEDTLRSIEYVMERESLHGPVNIVGPIPVTNDGFSRELARVLRRPAVLRAPRWALRAAIGAFADEAMLASTRAMPRRLVEAGFEFKHPMLADALRAALERSDPCGGA